MTTAFRALADADLDSVFAWENDARWGLGIATEALRQLLTAETERPLRARVAATNSASRRVLEKAGLRLVDEEPSTVPWRGAEVTELVLVLE